VLVPAGLVFRLSGLPRRAWREAQDDAWDAQRHGYGPAIS
jgi:hypothetical protein